MATVVEYLTQSAIYKDITLCESESLSIGLNPVDYAVAFYLVPINLGPTPQFIPHFRDDGSLLSLDFLPTTTHGEYVYNFSVYNDTPELVNFIKVLTVKVTVLDECEPVYSACCGGLNIQWVNRLGGIQNYYFNGVRTFEVSQENAKRYNDPGKVLRYSTRGQVYKGEIATTKNIPKSHVEILDSLRYSIQAWVNDNDTLYPILIDDSSYTKFKSKDKFFDVSLKFLYANPVNIQTQ